MSFAIVFPVIDPVAVSLGPFVVRWYALAYIVGILLGWRYIVRLAETPRLWIGPSPLTRENIDDFVVWATLGIILGGRLGYVLFYNPGYYLAHPIETLMVWQGGMSFHGGLLGVLGAIILFARRNGLPILSLGDVVCAAAPIGLLFGRFANFVNAELYGRVSDVSWAVIFPGTDGQPRHPSQIYEALLEGLLLFILIRVATHRFNALKKPGATIGLFLMGYGLTRAFVELYREPDAHIGYIAGGVTMGIILSLPMALAGLGVMVWALRNPKAL